MQTEKIIAYLKNDLEVVCLPQADSTNTQAARRVAQAPPGRPLLLTADSQTAGRGRRGRSFFSPAGGLYLSLALPLTQPPEAWRLVTPAAAVGACTAIEAVCGLCCGIKWVNDLELFGRKVCGILTETAGAWAIVGIGINLSGGDFPPELAGRAGSLYPGPPPFPPERLAAALADRVLEQVSALPGREFLALYRARSILPGRAITVITPTRTFEAAALGIDDWGGLIIEEPGLPPYSLQSGEVTVRAREGDGPGPL